MKNIKVDYKSRLSDPAGFERTLLEAVLKVSASIETKVVEASKAKYLTSEECLAYIQKDHKVAEETNLTSFRHLDLNKKIIHHMLELYPKSSIMPSGHFLYPATGGFMGWHTNSDYPCKRVYVTVVKDGGKSFFRYKDGDRIVTSMDEAGITVRDFDVPKEAPHFWHCVYAEEDRYSFGFRVIPL